MAEAGYDMMQGEPPPPEDVTLLREACQVQDRTDNGRFTYWRNPEAPLSTYARQFMHHGGIASQFHYSLGGKHSTFREPCVVRVHAASQLHLFMIGAPCDAHVGFKLLIRPLGRDLHTAQGFLEVCRGSNLWPLETCLGIVQGSRSSAGLTWVTIDIDQRQVLIIHAQTVVRFPPSKYECEFVCMGYSERLPPYSRQDVTIENMVIPFLRRTPIDCSSPPAAVSLPHSQSLPILDVLQGLRNWGSLRHLPALESPDSSPAGLTTRSRRIIETLQGDLDPIRKIPHSLDGDRIENLLASPSYSGLCAAHHGHVETLLYLLDTLIVTGQFVDTHPDLDPRHENCQLWFPSPGDPQKKLFAERQGYPESETVKALTRAVKAMAIAGQLGEPGAILLLYHVLHRLDHVPLSSMDQFCRELGTECPAFIKASPNFRDQLFQYLHCRHDIASTIYGVPFMSRRVGE